MKDLQRKNKTKTMQLSRKDAEIKKLKKNVGQQTIESILDGCLDEPLRLVIKDHIKNKDKPSQAHRFTNET